LIRDDFGDELIGKIQPKISRKPVRF